ncbi:MAG: hypothetical protein Q9204_004907 [Flavoplaca sp. TL-2023a]
MPLAMAPFAGNVSLAATLDPGARANGCIAYDPYALPPTYGYNPNLVAGIIFTLSVAVSLLRHPPRTRPAIRSRELES